jgi:hypothetical protein
MKTPDNEPRVRLKNLAALFVTAASLIIAGVFFRSHVSHDTYIRWGGLGITVAVLFGTLIRKSQRFHGMTSFWMLVTVFVILNLVIFGIVLTNVSEWKLPWFGVMLLEVPVFFVLRDRLQSR